MGHARPWCPLVEKPRRVGQPQFGAAWVGQPRGQKRRL